MKRPELGNDGVILCDHVKIDPPTIGKPAFDPTNNVGTDL